MTSDRSPELGEDGHGNRPFSNRLSMTTRLSILDSRVSSRAAGDFMAWTRNLLISAEAAPWRLGDKVLPMLPVRKDASEGRIWWLHFYGAEQTLAAFRRKEMFEPDGMPLLEVFDDVVFSLMCAAWAAGRPGEYHDMLLGCPDLMMLSREAQDARDEARMTAGMFLAGRGS